MNLQDYLMSEDDKAKLLKKLQQDIGFEDETFEGEAIQSNNEESQDEADLF